MRTGLVVHAAVVLPCGVTDLREPPPPSSLRFKRGLGRMGSCTVVCRAGHPLTPPSGE